MPMQQIQHETIVLALISWDNHDSVAATDNSTDATPLSSIEGASISPSCGNATIAKDWIDGAERLG